MTGKCGRLVRSLGWRLAEKDKLVSVGEAILVYRVEEFIMKKLSKANFRRPSGQTVEQEADMFVVN